MKEAIQTNPAHYIVAPPHYKHRIAIGGTIIISFKSRRREMDGIKQQHK